MAPCIRSMSLTFVFTLAYMVEPPDEVPPRFQAFTLILNSVSSVTVPAFKASNTITMVISLLMLAGCTSSSAFFSKNTVPDFASIRMACGAVVSNGSTSWPNAAPDMARNTSQMAVLRKTRIPFTLHLVEFANLMTFQAKINAKD